MENALLAFEPEKVVSKYKGKIEELKAKNDELAKSLDKATVESDWSVGKLGSLYRPTKLTLWHDLKQKISMKESAIVPSYNDLTNCF